MPRKTRKLDNEVKEERERKKREKEAAAAEQAKRQPINSHLQDRIRSIRRFLGDYQDQVAFTEDDLKRLVSEGGRDDSSNSNDSKNNNNDGNDDTKENSDNNSNSSSNDHDNNNHKSNNNNITVEFEPLLLDDEDHPTFNPYFFDPLFEEALFAYPIDLSEPETWIVYATGFYYLNGRYHQNYYCNSFCTICSIYEYNNDYGKGGQEDGDGGDEEEEADPLPNCLRFKDYDHEEAVKEAEDAAAAAPSQARTTTLGEEQSKKKILWTPDACGREIVRYLLAHIDLAPRKNMPELQNMGRFPQRSPTLRSRTCWTQQL
jgi:hypothetical protein